MASLWLPVLPALTAPPRPVPRAQRVATRSVAFTAVSCALAWKAWSARQARRRLRAVLSTGNLPLDLVLDGGLPHGLVEVYGPPQGGKTSLALSCVEAAVKQGRRCAVLDVDRSWPGTSSDLVEWLKPDYAEKAEEMMSDMVKSREFDLIVLDCVANLLCKAELDADIGTDHRGDLKSVLSRFCRKMQTILPHYGATILCTNQLRTARKTDLRNEATVGGNALRYRSALRLRLEPLVNGTLVQVERGGVKKEVELDLASWESSVVKAGLDLELVTRANDHLVFEDQEGDFLDLTDFLESHPQSCEKLVHACQKAWLKRSA